MFVPVRAVVPCVPPAPRPPPTNDCPPFTAPAEPWVFKRPPSPGTAAWLPPLPKLADPALVTIAPPALRATERRLAAPPVPARVVELPPGSLSEARSALPQPARYTAPSSPHGQPSVHKLCVDFGIAKDFLMGERASNSSHTSSAPAKALSRDSSVKTALVCVLRTSRSITTEKK